MNINAVFFSYIEISIVTIRNVCVLTSAIQNCGEKSMEGYGPLATIRIEKLFKYITIFFTLPELMLEKQKQRQRYIVHTI